MIHILRMNYDAGYTFNGYRVCRTKKGIVFCKYISAKNCGLDEALKIAMEIERDLSDKLSKCHTYEEVIKLKEEWK